MRIKQIGWKVHRSKRRFCESPSSTWLSCCLSRRKEVVYLSPYLGITKLASLTTHLNQCWLSCGLNYSPFFALSSWNARYFYRMMMKISLCEFLSFISRRQIFFPRYSCVFYSSCDTKLCFWWWYRVVMPLAVYLKRSQREAYTVYWRYTYLWHVIWVSWLLETISDLSLLVSCFTILPTSWFTEIW